MSESGKTPGQAAYEAVGAALGAGGGWDGLNAVERGLWHDMVKVIARDIQRERDEARELLKHAADALWACAKAALTVEPTLKQPYPDDPRWSPWTRFVERPAREAHDTAMVIRKHLRASETCSSPNLASGITPAGTGHPAP